MLAAPAIGAGIGLLKNELVDKPQHSRMQKAQAEITKYSPWTGMKGKTLTPPSAFGSMLQGGMAGLQLGMAQKAAGQNQAMMKGMMNNQAAQTNLMNQQAAALAPQAAAPMMQAPVMSPAAEQSYVAAPQFRQPQSPWMGMQQGPMIAGY